MEGMNLEGFLGPDRSSVIRSAFIAVSGPALVTLLAVPEDQPTTTLAALLYVLAVLFAARAGGAVAGVLASILSFLALNFFFTPPLHTFAVGSSEDVVALITFLVASVVVGLLLSSALESRAAAERRSSEARLVNALATRFLAGEGIESVLRDFAVGARDLLGIDGIEVSASFVPAVRVGDTGAGMHREAVRLTARSRDLGEMVLWSRSDEPIAATVKLLAESLGAQLALALDGIRLSSEVRRAELEVEASNVKAMLFSGVTHDVKTPLAAITAAATSLSDEKGGFSDSDRREHLLTIRQEADRLHRVVNNLLDLARLRAGAMVSNKSPTAIDELIESVLHRLRHLLVDRPIEMRVRDDLPEVPIDVIQIDQVLTNLIENAVKFSPPHSAIELTGVGSDRGVRITVSDRGSGIDPEDKVRIFGAFETGDGPAQGTGLGLAICKAIVEAHGGRIWVADRPGGGTSFTFELPAATEPAEEVDRAGARVGG